MQIQLKNFIQEFEPKLINFLDKKIDQASEFNKESVVSLQEIKKLVLAGGKRIRPALVYFGYVASGGKLPNKAIFEVGIGLELLHAFALIHDDIIDQAETRRGNPTTQVNLVKHYNNRHLGTSGAILSGDFAHALADEVFSNIDCENYALRRKLQHIYHKMKFELIAGQIDDTFDTGLVDLDNLDEARVIKMLQTKSGRYSIQKPLLLGSTLAELENGKKEILEKVGDNLGLVFQVIDDIIGLFGEEEETGKSTDNDITEGKRTLLIYRTYKKSNEEERLKIKNTLGKQEASKEDINWLKNLILEKKTKEELENYCKELVKESQVLIKENLEENQGTNFLLDFSDYLLSRDS